MSNATFDLALATQILGGTRSKTNASEYLTDFLSSGEMGREVDLNAGSFAGKKPKQIKMALDNARKKINDETGNLVIPGGTDVQVRVLPEYEGTGKDRKLVSEKLFVINTKLVTAAQNAAEKASK